MPTAVNSEEIPGREPRRPRLTVAGQCEVSVWGLSIRERHERAFERAIARMGDSRADSGAASTAVFIRADYILGEDLINRLVDSQGTVLALPGAGDKVVVAAHARCEDAAAARALVAHDVPCDGQRVPAGMRVADPGDLASDYNEPLRKRAKPLVLSVRETPIGEVERIMFDAVYKGATDFVTKWIWPTPARWVTRWAAAWGVTPNAVTTLSLGLVVLAALLFAEGQFLIGVPVAWAMTFLDTVDGKLARVTLTSSRWGNIYDHGIDLIHPPFWWWAWWQGLHGVSYGNPAPELGLALSIITIGYVLGRVLEGIFLHVFGIQTHIWRPVDSYFRTVTARRNPNLAILTAATLAGRPDLGFLAIAGWTIVSLAFHAARLTAAVGVRARGGEIRSWMSESK